jgi:MATE family multidrug resistance protein
MSSPDPMLSTRPERPGGYREVLRVALPLIVSMGSFTVMQFFDRMFLAWHSSVSIQAALPAGILSFTLVCAFMELAGYATTFVAQHFGAGDKKGCSRSAAQAIFLALGSWPFLLLLIPVGQAALRWAGHAPEVLAEELDYFTILMLGGVHIPLSVGAASFYTGRGDTRTTMKANLAANALNIILDYGLIFGHGGLPALGIRGAAIATVISGFVAPVYLLGKTYGRRLNEEYQTRAMFRLDPPLLRRIIRFALPSSIHFLLDITSFTIFVLFTGRMGEVALAASNMAFSINMLAFMPLVGLGIAASTLVGQYQGRREPHHAERAGWNTLRLGVCYTLAIGLTYVLFPVFYFSFFSSRSADAIPVDQLLTLGRWMLVMMALWGFLDAANVIISGALKGAGDTRFVMYYSVLMSWGVLVSGMVLIVFVWNGNILHAWGWLTIYVMILAIGYVGRFRSGRWKSIDLLGRKAPPPPTPPPAAAAEAVIVAD